VPPGFQFVEIGSSDIDRSLDFYQSMLDLTPFDHVPWPPHERVHWLAASPVFERERTAAQRRPKEAAPIFHHVAPTVSDLDGVPLQAVTAR
jgi:catechol 2,3-dioxygenase-like lactoylglutathione lyase family enzyme